MPLPLKRNTSSTRGRPRRGRKAERSDYPYIDNTAADDADGNDIMEYDSDHHSVADSSSTLTAESVSTSPQPLNGFPTGASSVSKKREPSQPGTTTTTTTSHTKSPSKRTNHTEFPPPPSSIATSSMVADSCTDLSSASRPSEALFIQSLVDHCKRIAPLWFNGVSQLREKNREENRRVNIGSCLSTSDQWDAIAEQIHSMDAATETESVVNLLKKLYKELRTDSVLWFIQCWLHMPEARGDLGRCAFSRGDAKARMRRIDGGRGSDKVWRLDTLVAMLYHGLPLSSTDTHLLQHTCGQELCVRPQHLRFRANAVALVIVLKALQQEGYRVLPPADGEAQLQATGRSHRGRRRVHSPTDSSSSPPPAAFSSTKNHESQRTFPELHEELDDGVAVKRRREDSGPPSEEQQHTAEQQQLLRDEARLQAHEDDCVDISGPFTIQEIQQFRKEDLQSCTAFLQKYTLSSMDEDILHKFPQLRAHLEKSRRLSHPITNGKTFSSESKRGSQYKSSSQHVPSQHRAAGRPPRSQHVMETSKERSAAPSNPLVPDASVAVSALMSLSNSSVACSASSSVTTSQQSSVPSSTATYTSAFTPVASMPTTCSGLVDVGSSGGPPAPPPVSILGAPQPGRITPRQPAKKRPEARTPTCELDAMMPSGLVSGLHHGGIVNGALHAGLRSMPNLLPSAAEDDPELAYIMSADEPLAHFSSDVSVSTSGESPVEMPLLQPCAMAGPTAGGRHGHGLPYPRPNLNGTFNPNSQTPTKEYVYPLGGVVSSSSSASMPMNHRTIMTPDIVNIISTLKATRDGGDSSPMSSSDFSTILQRLVSRFTPSPQLNPIFFATSLAETNNNNNNNGNGLHANNNMMSHSSLEAHLGESSEHMGGLPVLLTSSSSSSAASSISHHHHHLANPKLETEMMKQELP